MESKQTRQERLAAALRDNLKKRREQAREREIPESDQNKPGDKG